MIEVKVSNAPVNAAYPSYSVDAYIVTSHPTRWDVERAEREDKMIMVFLHMPEDIWDLIKKYDCKDDRMTRAWIMGYCHACGIELSHRVAFYLCAPEMPLEEYGRKVIEHLVNNVKEEPLTAKYCTGFRLDTEDSEKAPVLNIAKEMAESWLEKGSKMEKRSAVRGIVSNGMCVDCGVCCRVRLLIPERQNPEDSLLTHNEFPPGWDVVHNGDDYELKCGVCREKHD